MEHEMMTQTGARPDLAEEAKATQSDMGGYAFPRLFPVLNVTERSGTFSYAPANLPNTTGSAQENRKNGDAITSDEVKTEDKDWTVGRLEARTKIYYSEVPPYGGIEAADKNGGIDCVRRAYNKIELRAYEKVFSDARLASATALADGSVLTLLAKAAIAVRPYGRPYLYMTTYGLLKFIQIPEVRAVMFGTFGPQVGMSLLIGDQAILVEKLSPLIGFKGIIVSDSDIVGTSNDDAIAVIGLREEAFSGGESVLSVAKQRATYSFGVIFIPKGASREMPFLVSSFPDGVNKVNLYDAEAHYSLNELHGSAVVAFKMLADLKDYSLTPAPLKVEIVTGEIP